MGQSDKMTPYYADKLKQGLYYQDFVVEELYRIGLPLISYASKEFQTAIGENKAGVEIKNDTLFPKTGNIYIEIAEKSNKDNEFFVQSGIYRTDNTWLYIIGNFETIFILSKKQLIRLHKSGKFKPVETDTSKGFLLPIADAEKFAVKMLKPNAKNPIP